MSNKLYGSSCNVDYKITEVEISNQKYHKLFNYTIFQTNTPYYAYLIVTSLFVVKEPSTQVILYL